MRWIPATLISALSGRTTPLVRPSGHERNYATDARIRRATASFFNLPCEALARRLLGQVLVRRLPDGEQLSGMIVETECYPGKPDRASHTCALNRVTTRTAPLYARPGACAVTRVYGVHSCLSVSSQGDGACVLLRALEPLQGCARMLEHRRMDSSARGRTAHELRAHRVCSGPGKLCAAMRIDGQTFHGQMLWACPSLWLEPAEDAHWVVRAPRVGVAHAGLPWSLAPLRFYMSHSLAVSKRDEAAERVVCNAATVARGNSVSSLLKNEAKF